MSGAYEIWWAYPGKAPELIDTCEEHETGQMLREYMLAFNSPLSQFRLVNVARADAWVTIGGRCTRRASDA